MTKREILKQSRMALAVEVFTTNIQDQNQADDVVKILKKSFSDLEFNFDLEDAASPFPCRHSILRVVGATIKAENIISTVNNSGFVCTILEDKICK